MVALHCVFRPARGPRSLTLVEVILAAAVLLVALMGSLTMMSGSIRASQDDTPRRVANRVIQRVVTRLRSTDTPTAFNDFWSAPTQRSIGGVTWAVAEDASALPTPPTSGLTDEAQPLYALQAAGEVSVPTDDPAYVRLRVLNEAQYAQMWNIAPMDLDFDGDNNVAGEVPNGSYGMLPVVIEVRWSDPRGGPDGRLSYTTVVGQTQIADPNRP